MNKIPLPAELPWQIQLMFWVLMLLVGCGMGVSIWFLVRYVSGQDTINKENKERFEKISNKVEDLKTTIAHNANTVMKEMQDIQKSAFGVRQETLDTITVIKDDIGQMKNNGNDFKVVAKAVDAHHSILKAFVVKVNQLMIFKTKVEKGEKP